MKRRRMIQSVLGISAASALPAPLFSQTPPPSSAIDEHPKLALSATEAVAEPAPRFFDPESLRALRHLGEILVPPMQKMPGAVEAEAAEFLDFLIAQPFLADRPQTFSLRPFRIVLFVARLDKEARSRFGKPFADLASADADAILAPLPASSGPARRAIRLVRPFPARREGRFPRRDTQLAAMGDSGVQRRPLACVFGLNPYWFPSDAKDA